MAGPKKGVAFTFPMRLWSQADTDLVQTSVTLAAGDVQVSKDGGAFANIATLPTEIGTSGVLAVSLSADEMDVDHYVTVRFHDVAGDEWCDGGADVLPETGTISEIAGYTDDIGAAGAGLTALGDARLANLDAAVSSRATLGAGAVTWTYTLTSSEDGSPIGQADVWVTTDAGGSNVVARGTTSDLGVVTFMLDAGAYYFWRSKSSWVFINPDTEVVA